jgi:hypothetical protein
LRELNHAAEQADRNWKESHDAVTSRQSALQNLVAQFVGQAGDGDFRTLSTQYPIALFPVRIETRFQVITDNPRLEIRVYPDEILADSHEPSLTQQEIDRGPRVLDGKLAEWRNAGGMASVDLHAQRAAGGMDRHQDPAD